MVVLTVFLAGAAAILLLPTLSDLLSLAWVALARRPTPPAPPAAPPRLLVLVPAHNEELLIASCVRTLLAQDYPRDRFSVVVIADNCGDRTASIARAAGAQCLERTDPVLRGKPRAIAWALEQVPFRTFDAVAIVDADTIVAPDFYRQIAAAAPLRAKAVQAFFDLRNPDEGPLTRMAAVLATATHGLSYPFKQRAGLNVPLVGNGMVFGSDVLAELGWHAFSICEDWEMYALLSEAGVPIECAPEAHVYAQEARSLGQSSTQRERWTAGRLTVLGHIGPRILLSRKISARQKLDALAELTAPGPALHIGIAVVLAGAALAFDPPGAAFIVAALALSLVRPVVYTAWALTLQPSRARSLASFAYLPVYTLWRVGTAARALRMIGDKPWVRTERH